MIGDGRTNRINTIMKKHNITILGVDDPDPDLLLLYRWDSCCCSSLLALVALIALVKLMKTPPLLEIARVPVSKKSLRPLA